jgi:hypothetical protein
MTKRKSQPGSGRPSGGRTPQADFDSPWKEILDQYFEIFLAFFFPQAHADIDWSRHYDMLDKELQKIVRQAEHGRRYVDKLVRVWLKDGREEWLLIHVEIQTSREEDFSRRMYVYNYRLFDRYDREVVSLAVLADEDTTWRPSRFGYGRWGFHAGIEFPVVKLLDYLPHAQALEADPNPFAVVVLAHLRTLETRRDPADRHAWKVRLVKGLYQRGLRAEDVRQLFRFIDWIMELPAGLDDVFWDEITRFEKETGMPFITTPERIGMKRGLLKGIEVSLQLKFGAAGLELLPEIRELPSHELLEAVLDAIPTAASPQELRRVWTRGRRARKPRAT